MGKDFKAIIREGTPRYQEWIDVLGSNEMFLKSFMPTWASAPGIEAGLFFQMDLALLTAEQRERLIKHIATKFGVDQQEVAAKLDQVGCPVLDQDVTIVVHNPQRWL